MPCPAIQAKHKGMSSTEEIFAPNLDGVIVGETAISCVADRLRYRGYPVAQLVEQASFEEAAFLLIHGDLPGVADLAAFRHRIFAATLPPPVVDVLRRIPDASPMDALRSAVSLLAGFDPDGPDNRPEANRCKAERLLGQVPLAIAEHFRAGKGLPSLAPRPELGFAGNLLYLLRGATALSEDVRAFEVSLILYGDHEFNASTFTARLIASTEADLHAAITGGISALKGPLHGGANQKVMDAVLACEDPAAAGTFVLAALARKERIMGFGHRVHKEGDERAELLRPLVRAAAQRTGHSNRERIAEIVEAVMAREKRLFPNIDWPAGRLYHYLGLQPKLNTSFFVAARLAGWSAHVIEQVALRRLIRPRARCRGPAEREVKPLADRVSRGRESS